MRKETILVTLRISRQHMYRKYYWQLHACHFSAITHGSISPWYHNILSLSHTILVQTMDAFYEKVTDPKHNGAAFFAVCRGKVGNIVL